MGGTGGPIPPPATLHPQNVELICRFEPQNTVPPRNSGEQDDTIYNSRQKPELTVTAEPAHDTGSTPPLFSPLEPMLRAVLQKNPDYRLSRLDLVASRMNLRNIFKLVSTPKSRRRIPAELKFYVELIRPARTGADNSAIGDVTGTVLLSTGNLQDDDKETVEDDMKDDHGAEFLAYHAQILDSGDGIEPSNQAKIVSYDLAGIRCMVQYPPSSGSPSTQEKQKGAQEDDQENKKIVRVRKKTKIRAINDWMRKTSSAVDTQDQDVEDNIPVKIAGDEAEVTKDVEAWRKEQLDGLVDLRNALESVELHQNIPVLTQSEQINRQRGDSISSSSSEHSLSSSYSVGSSRSSVSHAQGDVSHYYHPHKKLQLLPTIAPTPPNEVASPTQQDLGFDTPLSNIWYRADHTAEFFETEAIEPTELWEGEGERDSHAGVVGMYRSTTKYRRVLQNWEREHLQNLWTLVEVLRNIRKAAGKAGRCKVVVESSGKVRAYRVKQSKEESEGKLGRVSILSPDLLDRWV